MSDPAPPPLTDVVAVIATRDFPTARTWYQRVLGRAPDLEPVAEVAEWQISATGWLQLIVDAERAGASAVRLGVADLGAQVSWLSSVGVQTPEPVVIADLVAVVDVTDPDGNEVSYVQDLP